jgi:hypothetical protein
MPASSEICDSVWAIPPITTHIKIPLIQFICRSDGVWRQRDCYLRFSTSLADNLLNLSAGDMDEK